MSDWKGIVKKGWHPEKEGTTLRGQVSGLLGRGGDQPSSSAHRDATPITSLKDPASFAPPPRRGVAPPPPVPGKPAPPARPGSNGGYSTYQAEQDEGVQEQPAAPPKPYRVDTTGLSTAHLPPPPSRRGDGHTPPPASSSARPPPPLPPSRGGGGAPSPSLPPRLPPRSGTSSPVHSAQSPVHAQLPSATTGNLNQGAVSRLSQAGISVPGFGIGGGSKSPAPPPPPRTGSPSSFSSKASGHMTDLSARFSKLGGGGSSSSPPPPTTTVAAPPPAMAGGSASQGTTWAEKQAALRTASNFHKNPSSVSFSEARTAAGTANNFRQRHGDQVASGMRTANNLGQKFGVVEKAPPPPAARRWRCSTQ
ncbi:hypothetical protein PG988_016339 [Apiospora saccharicola]